MKRFKRILLVVIVLLILSVTAFTLYLYYITNRSLPQHQGIIHVAGITARVDITFDQMGMPQIWANSERDAWFALGWLHASDRLFQMDLIRRVAEGRLSEILGDRTLTFDRLQRKIGHGRMAARERPLLDDTNAARLQAYTDGINSAARNLKSLPFEYLLLRIDFEPWNLNDCLSIFSYQTWFSDALQATDDFYLELAKRDPGAPLTDLMVPFPDWSYPTVTVDDRSPAQRQSYRSFFDLLDCRDRIAAQFIQIPARPFTLAQSSNAWVVAPARTRTGSAILASDPHLDISMLPQFWYAVGVHCAEDSLDVLGLTTPGLPFLPYGRNRQTGWAFTAGGVDVIDYYLEKLDPHNTHRYQSADQWKSFDEIAEIIRIHGRKTADTLVVKWGRHGPVMTLNDTLHQAVCLYWAGFDCSVAKGIDAGFRLPYVADFEKFRKLITNFGALNANWVYADRHGNIGYQLGTPVPVRKLEQQPIQLPGWDDRYDWCGYYPLEQTPHASNPVEGWLATCNNLPGFIGTRAVRGNFAEDRILRITDLLRKARDLTPADMTRFQLDMTSVSALRWKTEIMRLLKELGASDQLNLISEWQGQMDADSRAASIIESWLSNLKMMTFADEFGDLATVFNNPILFRDYAMEYLYFEGNQKWFDDRSTSDRVESREDIARKAMQLTLEQVNDRVWGNLQQLSPQHPLAQIPLVSQIFNLRRGPFARGGSAGTLNATTPVRGKNGLFTAIGGPSARLVFDFSTYDSSTIMLPAGQSGNPASVHFFDFYPKWEQGETWPVYLSRRENFERAVTTLSLEPQTENQTVR